MSRLPITNREGTTMSGIRRSFMLGLALAVFATVAVGCGGGEGPRPEDFTYEPLEFAPPNPDDFRTQLSNGLVVYIAEDHEIPWFNASLMVRTGPFLEPSDRLGVESFTPRLMREGGTRSMTCRTH